MKPDVKAKQCPRCSHPLLIRLNDSQPDFWYYCPACDWEGPLNGTAKDKWRRQQAKNAENS